MTPIIFGLGCLLELILIIRVRKELDFSMHFISAAFVAAFFFRLPFLTDNTKGESPFYDISTSLIFGLLDYFVFKMMQLRDKLKSETFEESFKRKRRLTIIMWVFYTFYFFGNACVVFTFRFFQYYYPEKLN